MRETSDFEKLVRDSIKASIAVKELLLQSADFVPIVAKVSECLIESLCEGNKVLFSSLNDILYLKLKQIQPLYSR